MNIVSLFGGMECGRIAVDVAGIPVTNYYSSEIDKYAVQASTAMYPDIIHLGNVVDYKFWPLFYNIDWSSIHLVIGGSPCQGFSFAGKQLAFDDPRSKLFFVYVDILNKIRSLNPRVKFLLENVKMKKQSLNVITDTLEVEPIFINSNLVSAQNRQRYYWCNWPTYQPDDKGVLLKDILESTGSGWIKNHGEWSSRNDKGMCIDANYFKGVDNHGQRTMIDNNSQYRKLTPRECGRLQTVPEHQLDIMLNAGISNTQLYKMFGNGWTIDVIAHLLQLMYLDRMIP